MALTEARQGVVHLHLELGRLLARSLLRLNLVGNHDDPCEGREGPAH